MKRKIDWTTEVFTLGIHALIQFLVEGNVGDEIEEKKI